MDPTTALIVAMVLLLVLIAAELPIAFSLGISGFVGLLMLSGLGVADSAVRSLSYHALAKYTLIIIPLFIAMGVLARYARIAEDAFNIAARRLGFIPGNLALASIIGCAIFAAVSGSSVAAVVAIGRPAILEMRKRGYHPNIALGVVGAAGTLGVLIPPSIVLVIYGILTGVSIGELLIGGVLPGILSAILYGASVVIRAIRRPDLFGGILGDELTGTENDGAGPSDSSEVPTAMGGGPMPVVYPQPTVGEVSLTATRPKPNAEAVNGDQRVSASGAAERRSGIGLLRVGLLFVVVLGGIYMGIFTAIESAAFGAVLVFLMMITELRTEGVRRLWANFREAMIEVVELNSMVAALLVGAGLFTSFVVSTGFPQDLNRWVVSLPLSPHLIIAILLLSFIPLGMILDPMSIMLIGVPLVYPVVEEFGFSGVWFGILVVKMIELGLITPPLGINAFVVAGVTEEGTVEQAFRGLAWFMPVDALTILLIFLIPGIVTTLPSLMG